MKDRELEAYVTRVLSTVYPDARQTNNSGAVSANGDVLAGPWLIECKGTSRQSIHLSHEHIAKSEKQAWRQRREWLMVHSNVCGDTLVTMDFHLFVEIISR